MLEIQTQKCHEDWTGLSRKSYLIICVAGLTSKTPKNIINYIYFPAWYIINKRHDVASTLLWRIKVTTLQCCIIVMCLLSTSFTTELRINWNGYTFRRSKPSKRGSTLKAFFFLLELTVFQNSVYLKTIFTLNSRPELRNGGECWYHGFSATVSLAKIQDFFPLYQLQWLLLYNLLKNSNFSFTVIFRIFCSDSFLSC